MALLVSRGSLGRPQHGLAPDIEQAIAAAHRAHTTPLPDGPFDLTAARAWAEEYCRLASPPEKSRKVDVASETFATSAGPVAARVYNPHLPARTFLFIHGGGWATCSLDTHDHIARWLADELGARVVHVDYALAPEHPYPTAIHQCAGILEALLEAGVHPIVIGDSAGANLGAMAILDLPVGRRQDVAGFISIYGAYAPEMNLSSHKLYGDGRYGLSAIEMERLWTLYGSVVDPAERTRLLGPLDANLANFPSTLCIGAECDLLLDDTLTFYAEFARASVDVSLALWPNLPHGCMHYVGLVDSVTRAAESIVRFAESRLRPTLAVVETHAAKDSDATRRKAPSLVAPSYVTDVPSLTHRSRLNGSITHKIACSILDGTYPSGALLPNEDKASAGLGVSRTAYREAMRTLAAKGLVSALPKVGTRVTPRSNWRILDPDILEWHFQVAASSDFIRELFELRKIVEPSAAALTASRRSDTQLAQLADFLSRMARLEVGETAWLEAVIGFHRQLLMAGGNEAIATLWPAIETTLLWSVQQVARSNHGMPRDQVADYARAFEKIASRDAQGAMEEMALLIDSALEDTMATLDHA